MANNALNRSRGLRGLGVDCAAAIVLSTWVISLLLALALAVLIDQGLGARPTRALITPTGTVLHKALVYASRLGMLPVVIGAGVAVAGWLVRRRRLNGAAAITGIVLVALFFGARSFAAVDVIGWRAALAHMVTDGRVAATTGVAIVTSFVLWHERMLGARAATWLAIGLPVIIGLLRVYLGAHLAGAIVVQWLIGAMMAYGIVQAYLYSERSDATSGHTADLGLR